MLGESGRLCINTSCIRSSTGSETVDESKYGFENLVDTKHECRKHEADDEYDDRRVLQLIALRPTDLAHFASDVIKESDRLILESLFLTCDRR